MCSACHRPQIVPVPDCGAKPFGTPSVEFAAATTAERFVDRSGGERLIVRVREGTAEQQPIGDASVAVLLGGGGADSGRLVTGRLTAVNGGATLDSLAPRRYELFVRRIGYDPFRQKVAVRAGFIDTVTISLRGAAVCLVE